MHSQAGMRIVEALLYAIYIIQPDWITKERNEWKNYEEVWTLIQKLKQCTSTFDTSSWKHDLLL